MPDALTSAAQAVADWLLHNKVRLCLAESCTGGWVAKLLTDIPGSSRWFECGLVTYSNAAKIKLLAVPESVLATHGAVSQETVTAMALGALRVSQADLAIAVSGIAGPDGGSPDKPVGLVWFAWAGPGGWLVTEARHFVGDRQAVRAQAAVTALQGLLKWPSHS
jgi:nicotinamide-nucleotide amidase